MELIHNVYSSNTGINFHHTLTPIDQIAKKKANTSHAHPQFEIYYLVKGEVIYIFGGKQYKIEPGSLLLVNAFVYHDTIIKPSCDYERYVVEFTLDYIPTINGVSPLFYFFEKRHSLAMIEKAVVDQTNILEILKDIEKATLENSPYVAHMILGNILRLLATIGNIKSSISAVYPVKNVTYKSKNDLYINEAIQYITANIDKKIKVDDIARHVCISRSYLQHIFKDHIGESLTSYIFKQKMHSAKYMLSCGKTLSETADALGYTYYSTFSADYKKFFGVCPKDDNN